MTDLRKVMDEARETFLAAVKECGFHSEWEAFQVHQSTGKWPEPVELAWNAYQKAQSEFYLVRDGKRGFLGGKGC